MSYKQIGVGLARGSEMSPGKSIFSIKSPKSLFGEYHLLLNKRL